MVKQIMDHRSASQLKSYRRCGERFYWERIRKEPYIPSAAAIQGSAFHEAYAAWEMSERHGDPESLFRESYERIIVEESRATPIRDWTVWGRGRDALGDIEIRRELGSQQIIDTCRIAVSESEYWRPLVINGIKAVELPFDVSIGRTRVIGSIDLVREMSNGLNSVRDLKTGGREYSPIQLAIYAFALKRQYGILAPVGDFWYAKDSTVKSYTLGYSEEYLARQFSAIDIAESTDTWVANPGPDCFNCTVSRKCREFK